MARCGRQGSAVARCPEREHVLVCASCLDRSWGGERVAFSAASVLRGPGELAVMVVEVTKRIFTRPFQFREFIEQAWFITSVTLMPTILVSIPFGAVISLQVGNLTGQLGAQSFAGATAVLAVVREAAPIAAALIIAGAAGSAICSDLGARKIREEIDAMEVLGVDPLERLVAPRVRGHHVRRADDQRHRDRRRHRRRLLLHRDRAGRLGRRVPLVVHRARHPPRPLHLDGQGASSSAGWPRSSAPTRASTPAAVPAASAGPSTRP